MIRLKSGVLLIWGMTWFLLLCCSPKNPLRTNPEEPETAAKNGTVQNSAGFSPVSNLPAVETGIASWYGGQFHGRRTANGEIYDMNRLTAAHPSLPFNTIVEVVNLNNRKKIIVRINDRGPFVKSRIIDLSFKAARILAMAENGIAAVELRILKTGELVRNPDTYDAAEGFYLQAGAFSGEANARRLLKRLNGGQNQITFEIQLRDGFYKILSRKFNSRRDAEKWFEILTENGFDVFIREAD
jgi:rare lipoprotein A